MTAQEGSICSGLGLGAEAGVKFKPGTWWTSAKVSAGFVESRFIGWHLGNILATENVKVIRLKACLFQNLGLDIALGSHAAVACTC